jgi:hypothetical protein
MSISREMEENDDLRGTMRLGTRKFTFDFRLAPCYLPPPTHRAVRLSLVVSLQKSAPLKRKMKRFFAYALVLFSFTVSAAASMVRVVEVTDARTLVVDDAGRRSTVHLSGVELADDDVAPATEYLRGLTLGMWVLVDGNSFVYRSPDGLYINGEMARHGWRSTIQMRYLGELDPAPRSNSSATLHAKQETASKLWATPPPHHRPNGLRRR